MSVLRWLFAVLHLLGLGIGLAAVWARGHSLRGTLDAAGIRRVLYADTWWGIAALLWISTGLTRLFASMEKSTAYYVENRMFWTKMILLAAILALEIRPMLTFIRWRQAIARGTPPDTTAASTLAAISSTQVALTILMVLAATAMARGFWA